MCPVVVNSKSPLIPEPASFVIPPNSTIELIQGGAKIVLKNGDTLSAVSDTASSVDIVTSYIDTISS